MLELIMMNLLFVNVENLEENNHADKLLYSYF
jgi:hypothetical protein